MKTNNIFKSLLVTIVMVFGAADIQAQDWSIDFRNLVTSRDDIILLPTAVRIDGTDMSPIGYGGLVDSETTLWEGEKGPDYDNSITIDKSKFSSAKDGSKLRIYATIEKENDWGFEPLSGYWKSLGFRDWPGETDNYKKIDQAHNSNNYNGQYFELTFTTAGLEKIENDLGMQFDLWGLKMTRISLVNSAPRHLFDSRVVVQTGTNWLLLPYNENYNGGGLYNYNSGARALGILNCNKGDIITFFVGMDEALNVVSNATFIQSYQTTSDNFNIKAYQYKVNSGGHVKFNPNRYIGILYISITPSTDPTDQQEYVTATVSSSTGYATFCSTEPLNFTAVDETLKAYIATSTTYDAVVLEQVTGDIAAGVGLVISGSTTEVPVAGTTGTTPSGNLLVGVTSGTETIQGSNKYVLTDESGKAKFAVTTNRAAYIPAGHAYLQVSNNARTRSALSISGGDGTTGINTLEEESANDGAIYNLSGQRVKMPTKGIYIINGKKVIVK